MYLIMNLEKTEIKTLVYIAEKPIKFITKEYFSILQPVKLTHQ